MKIPKASKQNNFLSCGFLLLSFSFFLKQAQAQIVPDATMPVNSIVTPSGNTNIIEGGTRAGGNLFHSFQEFSVPTGGEAFFNNALDVQNIFSRVTGSSISNIDGLIRALGTANLFFLNPNGIIFGPNAQLNIGGSFLASTANSVKFADGIEFSATNPQTAPLLTVSVPVGLQMGLNPGNIVVQGPGHNLSFDPETEATVRDNRPVGLQVAPGQTLALLSGNVALEGGNLTAEGGRIELGSVGGDTLVTLTPMNPGIALSYPDIQNFQDISLSKAASVDATGAGGGDVFVVGRRLTLTDGSAILALTEGAASGGTLSVRTSEVVEAIGTTPDGQFNSGLFANVLPGATGDGGDLTIETARLRLVNGAQIQANTLGSGRGGNLTVKATDTVELIGRSADGKFGSGLFANVLPGATGDGGNLTIETARLQVADGAVVGAGTFSSSRSGNLTVKAEDTVELIGTSADGKVGSFLSASVEPGGTGDSGNLTIETTRLRVSEGGQILATTFGLGKGGNLTVKAEDTVELIGTSAKGLTTAFFASVQQGATGDGGNLTIETARLRVADGAQVGTGTFSSGRSGNLTVKATDMVELIGTSADRRVSGLFTSVGPGATRDGGNLTIETARLRVADGAQVGAGTFGSGSGGNLTVKAEDTVELIGISANGRVSGLFASVQQGATGEGGNINIETDRLRVADGAIATVRSRGEGKAGSLTVNARSIRLENSGSLTADTKAGGGIIELRSPSITLQGGSISTNATGGESGGNITVGSQFLQLRQGSTITTNAEGENVIGGNITLNADAIVGLENSDITANSKNSQGGNITIDTQGIFGLQPRTGEELQSLLNTDDPTLLDPTNLPTSDITATGANSSLSGTLTINTPDVDPSSGLVELSANPVDATALVASTCRRQGEEESQFIVTGRGGLPPSPNEPIRNEATWMDLREIALSGSNLTPNPSPSYREGRKAGEDRELADSKSYIVEAQGWMKNSQGQVVLVAQIATATPHNSTFTLQYCHEP